MEAGPGKPCFCHRRPDSGWQQQQRLQHEVEAEPVGPWSLPSSDHRSGSFLSVVEWVGEVSGRGLLEASEESLGVVKELWDRKVKEAAADGQTQARSTADGEEPIGQPSASDSSRLSGENSLELWYICYPKCKYPHHDRFCYPPGISEQGVGRRCL